MKMKMDSILKEGDKSVVKSKQMSSLLVKELDIDAKMHDLYNQNRAIEGFYFLNMCFKKGFISMKTFQLKQARKWFEVKEGANRFEIILAKQKALDEVREYHQEKDELLEIVANIHYQLRRMKQKVELLPLLRERGYYANARIHVPNWNLFISPETQTLQGLFYSLIQEDHSTWVVSKKYHGESGKYIPVVYVIEKTKQFYEAYKRYREIGQHHVLEVYAVMELEKTFKN